MEFDLVLAGPKDIDELSEFSKKTFTETFKGTCSDKDLEIFLENTYSPEVLEQELKNKQSEVWFIRVRGNLAGFIKFNFQAALPYPVFGKGLEIQRLYLDTSYQGSGLGKKFMDFAESRARETGEEQIWLGVWEFNEKAKPFYEKLGFRYFGSHPFPIGHTPQVDLWMKKKI